MGSPLRCTPILGPALLHIACLCQPTGSLCAAEPARSELPGWREFEEDTWASFVRETGIAKEVDLRASAEDNRIFPLWEIRRLRFSSDGSRLQAVQRDVFAQVVEWDLSSAKLLRSWVIPSLDFCTSPDWRRMLMENKHKDFELREVATGKTLWKFPIRSAPGTSHYCYCETFDPEGKRVVFVVTYRFPFGSTEFRLHGLLEGLVGHEARYATTSTVFCCSVDTGKPLWVAHIGVDWLYGLNFSGDGRYLVCVRGDGESWVGERVVGEEHREKIWIWDAATGEFLRGFPKYPSQPVNVVCDRSGSRLLVACESVKEIYLQDALSGRFVRTFRAENCPIATLAFTGDETHVFAGGWGEALDRRDALGSRAALFKAGAAHLWDAATGNRVRALRGHRSPVTTVAFSPDGKRIATGTGLGSVHIWDRATGRQLVELVALAKGKDWFSLTPDGYYDGTKRGCQFLAVWYGEDADPGQRRERKARSPEKIRRALAQPAMEDTKQRSTISPTER